MRIWRPTSRVAIVRKFIRAINAHDIDALEDLVHEDFCLIDSSCNAIMGKSQSLDALQRMSRLSPEFRLNATSISRRRDHVLISGSAHSHDPRMARATQWRARVVGRKLCEWQAYAVYPATSFQSILGSEDAHSNEQVARV